MKIDPWIWVPEILYPKCQKSAFSDMSEKKMDPYAVAEFRREYEFENAVKEVHIRVCGDAAFQLFLNGACVMTGPATVGGDFLGNNDQPGQYYAYRAVLPVTGNRLDFFARVQKDPVQICEYSMGHGGLMISGEAVLKDGTRVRFHTDGTWLCRINDGYTAPCVYDGKLTADAFVPAQEIEDIWCAETAPIPPRTENILCFDPVLLKRGEKRTLRLTMDRIYAGFLEASATGNVRLHVQFREIEEKGSEEAVSLVTGERYRSFYLHSAGVLDAEMENTGGKDAEVTLSFIRTHYPVTEEANVVTSDDELNQVLDTCRHTLKYCRQTHHLDSPRHCEPLACTGDYYVETLMTLFSFGDMRLADFDVRRTARMLEARDGRMFHTTYSLIWVLMLWDVYRFTGSRELLQDCEKALGFLLDRFQTYIGETGLIETPPDFMFIDWIYIDGHSMHHPPKALGQSCLNMYYFAALEKAACVYRELGREENAAQCLAKAEKIRAAINTHLFCRKKGMYFEGLNTETPADLQGPFMPANADKRYYLKHSNILACCFGVCDDETGKNLIHRIMADEIEGDYQPWFAHWLMEAVYRLGLRGQYTRKLVEKWVTPVMECPKGLVEGFVKPEPTYSFDHSHAWGGTPLYSLPKALLGLDILEPGMGKMALDPCLLGLEEAHVECFTPYGKVTADLRRDEEPRITHPDEVVVVFRA